MEQEVMSEAYWETLLADADRAQAEAYEAALALVSVTRGCRRFNVERYAALITG